MSGTLVEAVAEPRQEALNCEEIARALIAHSAQASALAADVESLERVSDWHDVLEQVGVFAASLQSMQGLLATLTLVGTSRRRNPHQVDDAREEECSAVNRDVSDDLEEPEQEHESEDEETPIVAVRWALLSLGLLNRASDESSETEQEEDVAQDLQTSSAMAAAPKLTSESLVSVAKEDQTDDILLAKPSSPPSAARAQDSPRKPELLLLIAGLLKKKRETLLLRSSMSPEAQRRLREVEEDIARVEKELSLRGAATYKAIVSSPATPTPTISTKKMKDHHLSIPEVWAISPPSAGSTTTPASNAPLPTTPSPMRGTLARPRTWDEPIQDSKEVQNSPKPNEVVKESFAPGIDSGDAVLMASARSGAALLDHCIEVQLQPLEADPPITDKENLRCCPNTFFQVSPVNVITPRETYTKASPMPSPSPAFERRAASTPGRRAASSFGSTGLFRETPSPRTLLQQRSPATTPVPPQLPQPRSLFGSVSPPRYRNNAQLLEDWTNATATILQGTSAAGPSPSRPVPAWPAFDSNSPVKALPRAASMATVNRSPSAPVLGEKSRKTADRDVKFRRMSNISGRLLDDTPSNLTDFRKSLELATRRKDDRPSSRSRMKKTAPWR